MQPNNDSYTPEKRALLNRALRAEREVVALRAEHGEGKCVAIEALETQQAMHDGEVSALRARAEQAERQCDELRDVMQERAKREAALRAELARAKPVVDWAIASGLVMRDARGDDPDDAWSGGERWPGFPGSPDTCMCGDGYCPGGPLCDEAQHVVRGIERATLAATGVGVCVDCGEVPATFKDRHGDHYCRRCVWSDERREATDAG